MMLNNLPDEVLVHIISFLPTQCAIRTSILSSRWRYLSTEVLINLDFRPIERNWSNDEGIERVLMSRESKINKFYLDCAHIDYSKFKAWISKVVECFVQEICIVRISEYMEFPKSFFTCKTLVSLKLTFGESYYNRLEVPDSIHFPRLKVLHVNLFNPNLVLAQTLFCSSPVLEDLYIHAEYKDHDYRENIDRDPEEHMYNISSPCLKKLFIKIYRSNHDFKFVVNVDAPILESLEVRLVPFVDFFLKHSPALIRARLVYYETGRTFHGQIIKLLESVSFVKELSLGGHLFIPVFGTSSQKDWPAFPFVTHLTVDIHHAQFDEMNMLPTWNIFPVLINLRLNFYGSCSFKYFLKILSWVPNLSTLVINKIHRSYEFIHFEQAEMPRCLGSRVKEIKFLQFNGSSNELQILKYLLKSVGALEKLTVRMSDNVRTRGNLLNDIVKLPRSSKEIQFVQVELERVREHLSNMKL